MKGKHSISVPNLELVKLLLSGKTTELHKLTETGLTKKIKTIQGIASLLKCTTYKLKKMVKALADGVPIENLKWGAGRRQDTTQHTKAQKDWMIHRNTLRRQAGMSIQERANAANKKFGTNITKYRMRLIYKRSNITLQQCRDQMKPPNRTSYNEQYQEIAVLKEQLLEFIRAGMVILQYDECVFSGKQFQKQHWAPSGFPLLTKSKYPQVKYIAVLGFIDTITGQVLMVFREGAFRGEHIVSAIRQVKRSYPDDDVVIFGDNCKIHKTQVVKDAAEEESVAQFFNIRYRPDMMGIEGVWRIAKKFYKAEVAKMMITKRSINHMELVQSCIAKVTDEQCKQEAARGWLQLLNARPRDYDSQGEVMLESDDDY